MATLDEARAAKRKAGESLARLPQMCGIGVVRLRRGYGLRVNLAEGAAAETIPETVDGVPVQVVVVGRIRRHQRQPA